MPTQKPRIALTLPDNLYSVLDRLSDLTKTPKTKLIVEMLEQQLPIFEQVIDSLEKIQLDKENASEIFKQFAQDLILDSQESLGHLASEAKKL